MTTSVAPTAANDLVPLSRLPSVPAPAEDELDELHAILVKQIPAALDSFCNQSLAKFEWRSRAASGASGQLEVSLHQVNRSAKAGAAQLRLDFQCIPKGGQPVLVSMSLAPVRQSKQRALHYRLQLGGSFRNWSCAVYEDGELSAQSEFTRPNGLAALEHLATVWFASPVETTKHGVGAGVERIGNPIVYPLLESFWPRFSPASKKREWGLARTPALSDEESISINAEEWAACALVFCLWTLLLRTLTEPDDPIPFDALVAPDAKGLPPLDFYWPRRSVDLAADEVQEALNKERLAIPWHVIEAACAALNAGKHVIFTGPPGCGKSKLAGVLASLATGRDPLMVTASPAWTSGDLVGRYFPRRDGNGLEFRPGFFLRAIDEGNRWLIIDEFNRANIDECFGELFSVLADDVVELPFEEEISAKGGHGELSPVGTVRLLPARRGVRSSEASATSAITVDYAVSPGFRMIGTMNDADRSSLHQLSFALLRRFHIIRVEAPTARAVEEVIDTTIKRATNDLMLENLAYRLTRKGNKRVALKLDMVASTLKELFARDLSRRKRRSYTDLVQERVVGLATVQDIIRFIAEGIRGSSQGKDVNEVRTDHLEGDMKLDDHAEATCASFLALGITLSVFPQLDALSAESRRAAVKHIVEVFMASEDKPVLMRRVESSDNAGDTGLKLTLVEHTDPTAYDFDQDHYLSIVEFLIEELCQQYRGTSEAQEFMQLARESASKPIEV